MTRVLRRMVIVAFLVTLVGVLPTPTEAQRVGPGGAPPAGSGSFTIPFARVIDGHTIETWIDGHRVGIGLIGVTAEQANTPCGQEAAAQLRALLKGGGQLEEEPEQTFDAQNRRMYRVVTRDGRSAARELIRGGFARADGQGREVGDLVAGEQDARANRRGCGNRGLALGDGDGDDVTLASEAPPLLAKLNLGLLTTGARATVLAQAPGGDQVQLVTDPARAATNLSATLPSDFSEEVVATGLREPTAFAFLPDGRILVTQKNGVVRIIKNGALLSTPFIDLQNKVNSYWDHGLLAVAPDKNYATNGYVYLFYVYETDPTVFDGPKTSRLVRVTTDRGAGGALLDTASPSSEIALLGGAGVAQCSTLPAGSDCIPADSPSHAGGGLDVASDGTLFLAVGDAASFNIVDDLALRSQDLDVPSGKLLHVTTSGAGLSTNPFWNGNSAAWRSKVWSYGLRNPFRTTIRSATGTPYLTDVGWNTWESLKLGKPGADLGWPCYEGAVRQSGYEPKSTCQALYAQNPSTWRQPLLTYSTQPGGGAIVGGAFYTGQSYPAQYQGAYFFTDYVRGWIHYLRVDSNDALIGTYAELMTGGLSPSAVEMGSDGNLYYSVLQDATGGATTGQIRRIRYTGGVDSTPPTVIQITPPNGATNVATSVTIQATMSEAMDPTSLTASTFTVTPAGSTTPVSATVTYDSVNNVVTLDPSATLQAGKQHTVTLRGGSSGARDANQVALASNYSWTFTIGSSANTPPVPTISSPASTYKFKVGDVITLNGSATDAENGTIPSSGLTWDVTLYHCTGAGGAECHAHPFLSTTGASATLTAPDHGDQSYFEVTLTATDSGFLTATKVITIQPKTVQISLLTSPSGQRVVYDGSGYDAPFTATTIVNSTHTISAAGANDYAFGSWSDGGAQQHNVVAGSTDLSLTATMIPLLAASYASQPPTQWTPGVSQTYAITVTNTGGDTWNAAGTNAVRLGVHFGDSSDACCAWATDQRFSLPNDLAPGQSATISVAVQPPAASGAYVLRHQMVKENVAWFSQIQKTNVTVGAAGTATATPTSTRTPTPTPTATVPAQPLSASYSSTPPTSWQAGVAQTYTITITNTGTQTWNANDPNPVHLGVHFGDASDACCSWATDERFVLPNDVAPGAAVTLSIQVTPPTSGGSYVLRHQMVKELVAWFSQIQKTNVTVGSTATATSTPTPTPTSTATRTPTPTNTSTPVGTTLSAQYTSSPPISWLPGQTQTYTITVKNTGTETWLAAGNNRTRLGVHFGSTSDACCSWATDQRFALTADMAPGASQAFTVAVTAPNTAGSYVLRHQMVKEGVAWFSQIQKTNVGVGTLTAGYSSNPPTSWQPGVPQTYAITVTNTGTQPWNAADPNAVHLGVHFGGTSDACCSWATDQRVVLPNDVPAGASVTVNVQVIPPTTAGSYVLRHQMVKEDIAWFNEIQKTNVTVGATPTPVPTSTPQPTATSVPMVLSAAYSSNPPVTWIGGQTQTYSVTVTNTGTETWLVNGATRVRLGVHFGGTSDACCAWATDQRFALPNDMPPGASYTYTINVTAPATAGAYVLRHQMVKEDVAWFSQIQKTNVTVGTLAASYSSSPPTSWQAGAAQIYSVRVTNTGTLTWTAAEPLPVHLAVQFGDASDNCCNAVTDQRFVLPNDVPPGGSVTLNVQVVPPNTTGTFTIRHRLVKEFVAWFDQIQKTTVSVSAGGTSLGQRPAPPPAVAADGSQNLAPLVQSSPTPGRTRADGPQR